MKRCDICSNEHPESTKSCAPCQRIISRYAELPKSKLREALRIAYDRDKSGGDERYFKCFYTGIASKFNPTAEAGLDPLEHAFVLTIDHENPKDPDSRLVVSLHLINQMKNKLSNDEFREIVIALSRYFSREIEQSDFEIKFKQIVGGNHSTE